MNDTEASSILKSMVQFIRNHGDERVMTINRQADDEFTVQKENYIAEEKERVNADIKDRLKKDEIALKIDRSKKENVLRIERMRTVNELILKLYKEARVNINKRILADPKAYGHIIKGLIIQGLIRLMEPEVFIRCRKSDYKIVESVLEESMKEYSELMKSEVKGFKNKEVPIKINLDALKFLPEFIESSENPVDSCMGGILLHARKGRIVCSNTLDERLQLVYHQAIPEIREGLFPCLIKPPKPEKEAPPEGHHKH